MRPSRAICALFLFLLFLAFGAGHTQVQSSESADSGSKTSGEVYRVGGPVSAPRIIYRLDPEYSEKARSNHFQGNCVLGMIVGPDGLPHDIKVTRGLGMGLDEQAIEAVRKWRFDPALKDGSPVSVQINVEVSFHLYKDPTFENLIDRSNRGDAQASFQLYKAYHADPETDQDERQALVFLEKAAQQGLPQAQFMMGDSVSSHSSDFVTAYMWYALAQRSHYKHSDEKLKELAAKMSPEQLSEAQSRVESATRTGAK